MNTTTFPPGTAPAQPGRRRVVDAPTRVFHWLFALSFLGAYLTADGERLRLLHVTLGYTMAGLLVFRVLYGLLGPRQAGLTLLWRKVSGLWPWAKSLKAAVNTTAEVDAHPAVNWRQGQNLFMALAIVALLMLVLPLTLSGYATYNEWGDFLGGDWVADVHEFFGNTVLAVVLAHIAAIVGLSVLRRKNLAAQMVTGRADEPGPDLAKRNHGWLAALLLCAVLAYWTWEWQQSPQGLISEQAISAVLSGQGDGEND
ncbi:cytochrome b/b6 domain-containing protein [Rhodoferax saidenbachensis]|uniref:Cytochrome B n=1 Tax=Rhodoferax saidenbachensis TaxID=1484693 RepID=A0A1P8K5K6_9BURK|nr:cytochrome b/b6 domain-containing protein [Rhodoferax saidenbachensis]APW41305.1 cytochrome B [Rhodoferax saidenbachensis]